MLDFTARFRFGIPDFTQEPWHEDFDALVRAVDNALYQTVVAAGAEFWANSTNYEVGQLIIDNVGGVLYTCVTAHTSASSPTTFAQDRVTNPTYWNATANIPQQRGTWITATAYVPGDFVVDANRYAVCLVSHVSGVFNTDLAAGKWSVLVDLSNLGVGINAEAEGTIAAAASTDIGAESPTRLFVTGSGQNIADFGVVANQFKILRWQGANTLVHSVNLFLNNNGANRATEANDISFWASDATGKWRELFYTYADGNVVALPNATDAQRGIIELATQTEVDAETDTERAVTPATLGVRLAALSSSILSTIRNGVGATLDTLKELADAIALLAPKASPTFSGTVTVPDKATTDDDSAAANTKFVHDVVDELKSWVPVGAMQTVSGVAQVDFSADNSLGALFDGTYDELEIEFFDLAFATDLNELAIRVATGGGMATVQTGALYSNCGVGGDSAGTNLAAAGGTLTAAQLCTNNALGNQTHEKCYGRLWGFRWGSATERFKLAFELNGVDASGFVFFIRGSILWEGVNVTGIRLFPLSGGNMSGKFVARGRKT